MTPPHEAESGSLEEEVARTAVLARLFGEAPPIELHRYRLGHELGRGAHCVVYAGFDPELGRDVAIKLLTARPYRGRSTVATSRLLREARMLARLAHPNVVTVHDVGRYRIPSGGDGVFLVMERIDGVDLHRFVERERPSLASLLGLCSQVGRGLSAAHAEGVIHRDVKPSNVVVGRDGRARVLDFGLAAGQQWPTTASGETDPERSQDGTIVGTPRYMATEQHRGDAVDERSDQYSFCAMMWELISGAPAFAGDDAESLLAAKLQGPPSSCPPSMPKWLYLVLQRGLHPEPSRRFASMTDLVRALQRSNARRKRWALGVMLPMFLASASGYAVGRGDPTWCDEADERIAQAWTPTAEHALAQRGTDEATTRLRDRFHAYAEQWSRAARHACLTQREPAQAECLDERLTHFESVLAAALDGVDSPRSLHAALLLPPAETCGAQPPLASAPDLRDALIEVRALLDLGEIDPAGRRLDEIFGRIDEEGRVDPRSASEARTLRGGWARARGDIHGALADYRAGLDLAERSGSPEQATRAAAGAAFVAAVELGSLDEALLLLGRAEAHEQHLAPQSLAMVELQAVTGSVWQARGRFERATAAFERALEAAGAAYGANSLPAAEVRANLGIAACEMGRVDVGLRHLERALEAYVALLGPEHPSTAQVEQRVAAALWTDGRADRALEHLEHAVAALRAGLGDEHPELADTLAMLGDSYRHRGQVEQAEAIDREVFRIRRTIFGDVDHPALVDSFHALGVDARLRNDFAQAQLLHQQGLAMARRLDGVPGIVALMLGALGETRLAAGDPDAALGFAREALALDEAEYGSDHERAALDHRDLGAIQLARGEVAEAIEQFEAAIEGLGGPERRHVAQCRPWVGLAEAHRRAGEPELARRALAEAEAVCSHGTVDPRWRARIAALARG